MLLNFVLLTTAITMLSAERDALYEAQTLPGMRLSCLHVKTHVISYHNPRQDTGIPTSFLQMKQLRLKARGLAKGYRLKVAIK